VNISTSFYILLERICHIIFTVGAIESGFGRFWLILLETFLNSRGLVDNFSSSSSHLVFTNLQRVGVWRKAEILCAGVAKQNQLTHINRIKNIGKTILFYQVYNEISCVDFARKKI